MKKHIPQEHSARVLAIALAAWGAAVLGAAAYGIFTRISGTELAALALFAMLYAPATFLLDATLRGFIVNTAGRFLAPAAIAADIALVIAVAAIAGEPGPWQEHVGRPGYAFMLLFVAPLAVVLQLAWRERGFKRSPARSPAASRVSI
jgi:hypothetical protein